MSFFRWLAGFFGSPSPEARPPDEPDEDELPPGVERSIDLHFFVPRDIPSVVDEYLREASARGFDEVRLIHGRGKGIQRVRVQKILARHALVVSFRSDGLGSTLAVLRLPRRSRPTGELSSRDHHRSKRRTP